MQAFFIGQCYWSWQAMQMHRAIEAPTRGSALCRNHTQQAALALPRGRAYFLLSQRVPPSSNSLINRWAVQRQLESLFGS